MKKLLLAGIFLILSLHSFGQGDRYSPDVLRRDAFYVNVGFLSIDLNYERKIMTYEKGYLFGRVGAGYWAGWAILGANFKFHLSYIYGKKNSHLEFNLGARYKGEFVHTSYNEPGGFSDGDMLPIVNIGYRYQKPGRPFVFRAGIGTESVFYLSIGTSII